MGESFSAETDDDYDYDVAVVGSGFGGSVAALRLTEKGYRVVVLEAGRRFGADDFPKSSWDLRNFLYAPRFGLTGIQRMKLLSDVLVLSGAGVGGGSLVYANTLYEPLDGFYRDKQWAHIADWRSELAPYYTQAKRMLGVTKAPDRSANDDVLREIADRMDVAETYRPTDVGVYIGRPGETVDDPYFGGVGPKRTGCIECGGCMVGCRHGAKNTLDRNYLYLAESAGAVVMPERKVVELVPLATLSRFDAGRAGDAADSPGYRLVTERPGPRPGSDRSELTAAHVVLGAGVLGTVSLLASMKERGVLPRLSNRLGELTRTNSESIVGSTARTYDADRDFSKGLAISSSIYPNAHTHIEGVKYPAGSNAMGLLSAPMVSGSGRLPRPVRFGWSMIRHPRTFLRSLSVRQWSERTMILLVMQSRDNSINLRWKRRGAGVRLRSEQGTGEANPTYIPEAEEAAALAAEVLNGDAGCSLNEAVLNTPVTAHILGGCVIGDGTETGVLDPYQRVYGHAGLHVVDGSAVSANLGVNPSLTITAQAERAMALWPNKGEADPRPELGADFVLLEPVAPLHPVVPVDAPAALGW